MPDSNCRIVPHAMPVPTTTTDAAATATKRMRRLDTSTGYLRDGRRPGTSTRRARLDRVSQRIVIFGAGGLVGTALTVEATARGHEVLPLPSAVCDVTDAEAVVEHVESDDVVVNCAAYTKVDDAEAAEAAAWAVNVTGAQNLARACARAGAGFIHVSTDYVFSGKPDGRQHWPYEVDDDTGPLSVYGRTKLAGEYAVLSAMPGARVVRTSWIYLGGDGGDFVAVMRRKALGDGTADVVADQSGSPTFVGDLVGALLEVAGGVTSESV